MQYSHRVLALASLAFIAFRSPLAFGSVLTVGATGANYTQIQDAVNAAGPDDVILIGPGSYNAVTIDGKSLTLCRHTGFGSVTILGTTTVKNLTASQRVILSGLRGYGPVTSQLTSDAGVGLSIANNAGYVRVEYCAFFGAIGWGDNGYGIARGCCSMLPNSVGRDGAALRDNSQGVSFTACELQGGRAANAYPGCWCGNSLSGGDGLRVQSTLVSLYDCNCIGGRGGNNGSVGGDGAAGCRTTAGTSQTGAFASGSRFQAGNGGDALDYLGQVYGGGGGTGLLVGPSTGVHLLDNTYIAGVGGTSYYGGWPPGPSGTQVSGGGSIFYDPESRIVMTTDRVARAGSVVDLRLVGTPGQVIHLRVSRTPTFMILASWRGTVLSLPGKGAREVPVGTIPASGVLQTRYLVPPLPTGAASLSVFVQAYRVDPVLGPKLAAGTCITLLP